MSRGIQTKTFSVAKDVYYARRGGMPIDLIVDKFGVSEKTVRRICSSPRSFGLDTMPFTYKDAVESGIIKRHSSKQKGVVRLQTVHKCSRNHWTFFSPCLVCAAEDEAAKRLKAYWKS